MKPIFLRGILEAMKKMASRGRKLTEEKSFVKKFYGELLCMHHAYIIVPGNRFYQSSLFYTKYHVSFTTSFFLGKQQDIILILGLILMKIWMLWQIENKQIQEINIGVIIKGIIIIFWNGYFAIITNCTAYCTIT